MPKASPRARLLPKVKTLELGGDLDLDLARGVYCLGVGQELEGMKTQPDKAASRARIKATFTDAQAASLWMLCDSTMSARLTDGDRSDAAKWRRLRDKFALAQIRGGGR